MMGHNGGNQNRLFYSFNLEDHVPANHLLRGINQFLDLTDLRAPCVPSVTTGSRPVCRLVSSLSFPRCPRSQSSFLQDSATWA
jgi:hypothetical protein